MIFSGATYLGDNRCSFRVWAPGAETMELRFVSPVARTVEMTRDDQGYWTAVADSVSPGTQYLYRINGALDRPDPASQYQPSGVHKPSAVVDHGAFSWSDCSWKGIEPADMVMYELHIGTFTDKGTFDSAVEKLDRLCDLGINAVEIMPVSQFPGGRNWGYDGVHPFCVQNTYGGPDGLKRFIDACHKKGLAVILDVVYNHLGPEGNYLRDFGPYFTDRYKTPWGEAINFDGEHSNHVREFFFQNALYWLDHFHIDALRLDAVHAMFDMTAIHFLRELQLRVSSFSKQTGRPRYCIAESDLNDPRLVRPANLGGHGLHVQWSDDFHHALHVLLTAEKAGYYADFGGTEPLARAMNEGYAYTGQYSPFRKRNHGASAADLPPSRFAVCSQNHDQVGNRMLGERLATLVPFASRKLAAAVVLLSPQIPLLFMGEEWGEMAPFLYFVSHGDKDLAAAVSRGRKEEFKGFHDGREVPDPQDEATFLASKLHWKNRHARQDMLLLWYRRLVLLRKEMGGACSTREEFSVTADAALSSITLQRKTGGRQWGLLFNFSAKVARFLLAGTGWEKAIDSSDTTWGGPGPIEQPVALTQDIFLRGMSAAVYSRPEPASEGIKS